MPIKDYSEMTYADMARMVGFIREEVKRRNPLFANLYAESIQNAEMALIQLANKKQANPGYDEADEVSA